MARVAPQSMRRMTNCSKRQEHASMTVTDPHNTHLQRVYSEPGRLYARYPAVRRGFLGCVSAI